MVSVVIHSNPTLPNQIESALWLKRGFDRHGLDCEITADKHKQADIHVVQGPHYAFNEWLGKPNVIWLDRCFYGDHRYDLSIGWLNPDGSRDFKNKDMSCGKGDLPELKPQKTRRECAVVFGDYGMNPTELVKYAQINFGRTYYKPHPAERGQTSPVLAPKWTLDECWEIADCAVGHSSTVLVTAELNGLHVYTTDTHHVCQGIENREQWLVNLSWAQWNSDEICYGDFIDHLSVREHLC